MWVPGSKYDHVTVRATHGGPDDTLTGLRGRGTETLSVSSNLPPTPIQSLLVLHCYEL